MLIHPIHINTFDNSTFFPLFRSYKKQNMKKITQSIGIMLILLISFSSISQETKIPIDNKVKIGKLANGLTYYIRQNKKPEQKVELRLVINAGSVLEDDDQQGLAHMCEHMAFNGTKNFKRNEIVSFLQSIGVGFGNDLNAYTSFDETVYMLPIPTDKPGNIEKGFQVLEDWAHNVTYLDEDIEGERNIILEESRLGKGAEDRMFRKVYPVLFEGSKYANRLPIGVDSIIKNHKYETIRRFYKDWYRPNLMAVVVVGDIDVAQAEAYIKKHFEALTNPANERPRVTTVVPAYTRNTGLVVTDKEATMYQASMVYSSAPSKSATTINEYKDDMIESLFSTILNQRLRDLTQKENPPFLGAGIGFDSYARGYKTFQAQAYLATGDVTKSLTTVVEEIEKVKRFGFTQAELDRAKTNLLIRMERMAKEKDKTESSSYVEEYIRNFLTNEPIPGIEVEYQYHKDLLPTIKLQDVNALANSLKGNNNFVTYINGPDANATSLPTGEGLVSAIKNTASKTDIKAFEEKAVATTLLKRNVTAGKIVATAKNAQLGTTTYTLSNGIKVTIKKTDFKNDEILMSARRFGGQNNYGLEDKYNATYATQVVGSMGVGEFSPTDLRKALTGKVANVSPLFSAVSEGFRGNSSVKDFETMLQLVNLYVYEPRKDTSLYKSFIQKSKSQTAFMLANPQTAFIDTLYTTMYGNNPLAPVAVPKAAYYDKVNMERVLAIYKERFGDMSGMHFTFVGSLPKDTTERLIEKYIASLPVTVKKYNYKDNGVRPITGKINLNVNKGKEEKSLILAMYSGETPYSEDLDLKANAITEVLNIKIIEELREKIQGIYGGGTGVQMEKYPYNHYTIFAQLPCGPAKVDTLLSALNSQIDSLKIKGPSVTNLNKVKLQWIEEAKTAAKENGTWLQKIQDVMLDNESADRFINYEKYVNALTPEQIKATANLLFNGKNVLTAVLKPEAKK
jgi:zinc protease